MKKRWMAGILAGIFLAGVLNGCGSSEAATEQEEEETAAPAIEIIEQEPSLPESDNVFGEAEDKLEEPAVSAEDIDKIQEGPFAEELKAGEVENNGGYFVRAGDQVYFGIYGMPALVHTALFGQFLQQPMPETGMDLASYNLKTGELAEIGAATGSGKLFLGKGGIYLDRVITGAEHKVICLSPDGASEKEIGPGRPVGISKDGNYLAVENLNQESYSTEYAIYSGDGEYLSSIAPKEEEWLEFCGITGNQMIIRGCAGEINENRLYSVDTDGTITKLGVFPAPPEEYVMAAEAECDRFFADEEGVYMSFTYYQGTGHFKAAQIGIRAVPGKEDSLTSFETPVIDDGEEGENPLALRMAGVGSPEFVRTEDGSIGLSNSYFGDLVYHETPQDSVLLSKDFLPEDKTDRIAIQDAVMLRDGAFVLAADMERCQEEDIGWREAYTLDKLRYLFIPYRNGQAGEEITLLEAQ